MRQNKLDIMLNTLSSNVTVKLFKESIFSHQTLKEIDRLNPGSFLKRCRLTDVGVMTVAEFYDFVFMEQPPKRTYLNMLWKLKQLLEHSTAPLKDQVREGNLFEDDALEYLSDADCATLKQMDNSMIGYFYEGYDLKMWNRLPDRMPHHYVYDICNLHLEDLPPYWNEKKPRLQQMIDFVRSHAHEMAEKWRQAHSVVEVPKNYDAQADLGDMIALAIKDAEDAMVELQQNPFVREKYERKDYNLCFLLARRRLIDDLEWTGVTRDLTDLTVERYRQKYMMLLDMLLDENTSEGVRLRKDMIHRIQQYQKNKIYGFYTNSGKLNKSMLSDVLGFDKLTYKDGYLYVPTGKKGKFVPVMKAFLNCQRNAILPKDHDWIVRETLKEAGVSEEYMPFVNKLFALDCMEQTRDGLWQLKYDALKKKESRVIRAMQELDVEKNGGWFDKTEIQKKLDQLNRKYHLPGETIVAFTKADQLGFIANGNVWSYRHGTGKSLVQFVYDYVHEHVEFSLDKLCEEARENGYPHPKQTFRVYVGRDCVADLDDIDHFCLESVAGTPEHPGRWSTKHDYGTSNQILHALHDVLMEHPRVEVNEAVQLVLQHIGVHSDKKKNMVKIVLMRYVSEKKSPFKIVDGVLEKGKYFDETDFDAIGLKGNYKLFKEIRKNVLEEMEYMKDEEDFLLPRVVKRMQQKIGPQVKRHEVIRAIENKILNEKGPEQLAMESVGRRIFIRRK